MRRLGLAAWIAPLSGALLVACGGGKTPPPKVMTPPPDVEVPGWVFETPTKPGYICATGAVDRTYYQQDGRVYAAEAARNELARTIQVTIYSVMYDYESTRGGSVRQYIVSEVESAVAGGVLNGAEIVHSWYDKYGNVANAGMTYALACMKKDQSVKDLADKIKEAYPEEEREEALAGVRKRAEAAFDDLEAMEAKHAEKKSGAPTVPPPDVPPPATNPEEAMGE